jgi:outer membrane protein assembly factor BamD (BamD/ComL family)
MSKQKILLILTIIIILIISFLNISRLKPESKNYQLYIKALEEYNNNKFPESYHTFNNISKFSKIKPAAIYRQALCAEKLHNKKLEIKKYKEVIRKYPNSILSLQAKYLQAQRKYEDKDFKSAEKEFKKISNKHPKTDYAIASYYYLASIDIIKAEKTSNIKKKENLQNNAISNFKVYLNEAPAGKFSLNCIEKWLSLNHKLNNEDNLLVAKVYQKNNAYQNAQKYLKFTNFSISWPYFVKNAYEMKDYAKVKYYTQEGLKGKGSDEILINESENEKSERENIYKAIDLYLKVSNSPNNALSYLLSLPDNNAAGYDYLRFKNCNILTAQKQIACFNTLFNKYPSGQFAAESLSNIFYDKIKSQKYLMAKKLGKMHLIKFPNSKSAPRVMFWMAKISERTKNYTQAREYYKKLMRQYPDDYYAYQAFLNLNKFRYFDILPLREKKILFPYQNSEYEFIIELANVKDYGLINQLCKEDSFIQSWLAYLQGDFSRSAVLARDAMDKLPHKPNSSDLRWRLVYPMHYYEEIQKEAAKWGNNPTLILSIIREESYFNPKAKSPVGARGLMQLMPATAKEAGTIAQITIPNNDLLFDSDLNIKLGNIYYSQIKKRLHGKDISAILAYNGGFSSVSEWKENLNYFDIDDFIEQVPYSETQNYLKKVYRSYWNYIKIYDSIKF